MTKEFSRAGYGDLLTAAHDQGYDIRPIRDAFKDGVPPILLLRHDVDLSLRFAMDMALLEHERGITATYYILPHNDFYNPLSPEGRRDLRRMADLGHEIGLHCDGAIYPAERAAFCDAVRRDIAVLEDIIGQKVVSASQHSPIDTRPIDFGDMVQVDPYAAAVMQKFAYASDSSMSWRTSPWDLLQSRVNLQLLVHPVWWMTVGTSRAEKFRHLKQDAAESQAGKFDGTLAYIEQCLADREQLDVRAAERRSQFNQATKTVR
jgi:hypothetical protein